MGTDRMNEIVNVILKAIDHIPTNPPRDQVRAEFMKIKELIADSRPPRIVILGRRGAGKSSIVNAIFKDRVAKVGSVLSETGKPEWHDYSNEKGTLHILDTRGLGDRTKPESANFSESIDEIKEEIKPLCPDAILFLCKAKEVDAHIVEDVKSVIALQQYIASVHDYEIPVAGLVTQVDELDPKRIEPPYEDPKKQKNINDAVKALSGAFSNSPIELLKVIPVSAYAEYDNGSIVYDNCWNIESLIEYLMEHLPNSAQLQMARLSLLKKTQRKFARTILHSTAVICGGLAATPIPVADLIPITTAQIGMIMGVAYISGRELSKKTAKEFLVAMGMNVGAGFALREGARALIKYVFPGGGLLVSAGIAYAGTWGVGEAAIAYFIDNASIEEAKHTMKMAKKKHENDDIR